MGSIKALEFVNRRQACDMKTLVFGFPPGRRHENSKIVFLLRFDEMSGLDAFSLNTVPSFVLRKHRYFIKTYIYQIQQSRSPYADMLQKRESQKLKHFELALNERSNLNNI